MSALNTYTSKNRLVTSGLVINYSKTKNYSSYSWKPEPTSTVIYTVDFVYAFIRTASKTYKYVGMDKATAISCKEDMIDKYTRSTRYSSFDNESGKFDERTGGAIVSANIYVKPMDNNQYSEGLWECVIEVNEQDTIYRNQMTQNIPDRDEVESLFSIENQRDYDED